MTNPGFAGIINLAFAGVAHLVERDLAKVEVASSSLVARSRKHHLRRWCFFFLPFGAHRRAGRLSPAVAVDRRGHFLEIASLLPPPAALRRFPRPARSAFQSRGEAGFLRMASPFAGCREASSSLVARSKRHHLRRWCFQLVKKVFFDKLRAVFQNFLSSEKPVIANERHP